MKKTQIIMIATLILVATSVLVAATTSGHMTAYAQKNTKPHPNNKAIINACIKPQPRAPNAAFCLPA